MGSVRFEITTVVAERAPTMTSVTTMERGIRMPTIGIGPLLSRPGGPGTRVVAGALSRQAREARKSVQTIEECYLGWCANSTLWDVLSDAYPLLPIGAAAVVSSIDSASNIASMTDLDDFAADHQLSWQEMGSSIGLAAVDLLTLVDRRLNFAAGFDEAWVFGLCAYEPPLDRVALTSELPITEHNTDQVAPLCRWMRSKGCLLGIGDGDGANYITTSAEIARRIAEGAKEREEESNAPKL